MFNKLSVLCAGATLALALIGTGCGGHKTVVVTGSPTLVYYNGIHGYYQGSTFCYYGNNYCGTGQAYGIITPTIILYNGYYGYYYNNLFCDWTNNYCGTDYSWGIGSGYCDFNYCGVTYGSTSGSTSGYTSGSTSGTYSGSTSGTVGSTSGTYSGSTSGTVGSTSGTYSGSTSGTVGSTSGYYGSTSGSTTSGSTSGYYGSTSGSTTSGSTSGSYYGSTSGSYSTGGSFSTGGSTGVASLNGNTKDVETQRYQLQAQKIENEAQSMAAQFGMNMDSARQLSQIADKMEVLKNQANGMTAEDYQSLTEAALGVVGVSQDQVTNAAKAAAQGDKSQMNSLISQAAYKTGASEDGVRSVLNQLGVPVTQ